jgi:hypothetical protein
MCQGLDCQKGIKAQKSVTSMEGAIGVPTAAWSTKHGKLSTRLERGCYSGWTGVSMIYQQAILVKACRRAEISSVQ